MICFPNAKINIGLNIAERRNDGYHNIETVYYPVGLSDILEFVVSESMTKLSCSGYLPESDNENNLVLMAYRLLKNDFHFLPELNIHLHKIIPAGAGLGGGSSDAAFMLRMLNDHFELGISYSDIINYALSLGSDCPLFLMNRPCFATGRGEQLEELNLNLKNKFVIIVYPGIQVNTKEAYQSISPMKPDNSLKDLVMSPVSVWKDIVNNDFEKIIPERYPEIMNIKNRLYDYGAEYAQMSGSGSSVYGIFSQEASMEPFPDNYFTWKGLL
jgi:4-diphosphocytidyl-2-C-methyl-D-erythritol kinase